ncbi:pseudouridine synthase [Sulfitobacter donghicola]|uniref:Pseudouridine synthase n=1 Tax=Sulfitobacter donghicola DSW-25 = KCTC 12864 = JCM 14565 TaxID=1300350 RepID=A0A073IJD1_9RHOB|nr:pseudouridine synthase [Sulfitobacter donghicola]KEJ89879.1 rRNA pseudouridine synthase [Sulfitobacter donghicola DSW-25 = KCTC 12864 = JCM 14565]
MNDTPSSAPKGDRIAKTLSRAGVASRREAERMIEAGRVSVNGQVITSPALNVTEADRISVDGKPVGPAEPARMWLYHKPTGLVTSDSDEKGRQTIYDTLPDDLPRVMSIGRLDLNSEGLLLLTNDGGVKRLLELPSTGWLRRYRVRVNGRPTDEDLEPLRKGIIADGEPFQPMEVVLDRQQGANAWLTVGLREGKNREIRRAMDEIGLSVNRLLRVSYGPFQLGDLKPGSVEEVRRKVLRDQLGADAEKLLGAPPSAPTQVKRSFKRKTPFKGEFGGPGRPGRPKPPEEVETARPKRGKGYKPSRPDKATREAARRAEGKSPPRGATASKPRKFSSSASKSRGSASPKTPRQK